MKYKCEICGHIYDEDEMGMPIEKLEKCPTCQQNVDNFILIEEKTSDDDSIHDTIGSNKNIRYMKEIREIAQSGEGLITSMSTKIPIVDWDDILILGCQLNPQPLEEDVEVNTKTIIGKNAKKPMIIDTPIYVTHMSFGALSREVKIALSKGSAMAKTAIGSGEGGILPIEFDNAYKYIFEYVPNLYSVNDENLKKSDAIEIKIGQSTKPGLGGQLEGTKVTEEIAKIRGKTPGESIHSPATFKDINSKEDLKNLVDELRQKSEGRPIGIKLGANHIEKDLDYVIYVGADFVTFDGRGGATGASPQFVRDSTSVPTIYALDRARKYLDEKEYDISLIITGGLRISADFAKALAMGADAIAIGTPALISAGCQQYRICQTGDCPMGITTQKESLRKYLEADSASLRVYNFLNQSTEELKTFARITGHDNVHDMNIEDLTTVNSEISNYTRIKHV